MTVYTLACTVTLEGEKLGLILQRIKRGDLSYIREGSPRNPITAPDGVRVDLMWGENKGFSCFVIY